MFLKILRSVVTYFSLIIDYGMYLKCLQKPRCLGSKQAKALWSRCVENTLRLNSSKDNFIARSFRLSTKKETEHSFELSLSICAFCRHIFNLEMQNFSLENHHIMTTCQPFCWWMTFTKVSNPFLPSPPEWWTWPWDVCGGVGYGWFYWFSLDLFEDFFPKPLRS